MFAWSVKLTIVFFLLALASLVISFAIDSTSHNKGETPPDCSFYDTFTGVFAIVSFFCLILAVLSY